MRTPRHDPSLDGEEILFWDKLQKQRHELTARTTYIRYRVSAICQRERAVTPCVELVLQEVKVDVAVRREPVEHDDRVARRPAREVVRRGTVEGTRGQRSRNAEADAAGVDALARVS
jgi:hypothetical protein